MSETFIPHNFIMTISNDLRKGLQRWFIEIFFCALLVRGPVSSWISCSNNPKYYRKFYCYLQRLGRYDETIQNAHTIWLVNALKENLQRETVIRLALDDSPIKRYGPKIEGAGYMHDPTNVIDKSATCYGHSWVVLSQIVNHSEWGTISLPFRWRFYVRKDDLNQIDEAIRPKFLTKIQIGIDLINQAVATIRKSTDKPIQLTFDIGYVSSELFEAMDKLGVEIVTRFKKNTNFYKLPEQTDIVKRGRPRKYGDVFKLKDWLEDQTKKTKIRNLPLYGGVKQVEFKTMIATSQIVKGRPICLVASRIVKGTKAGSWSIFVSTNLKATPESILLEYSRRFSIEEMFKDLKEVCGLGSQEVRKWESCKACTTIIALNYTAIEIWAWERKSSELTALRSPWDSLSRRPSHKNKRDMAVRKMELENFSRIIPDTKKGNIQEKIRRLARLLGIPI